MSILADKSFDRSPSRVLDIEDAIKDTTSLPCTLQIYEIGYREGKSGKEEDVLPVLLEMCEGLRVVGSKDGVIFISADQQINDIISKIVLKYSDMPGHEILHIVLPLTGRWHAKGMHPCYALEKALPNVIGSVASIVRTETHSNKADKFYYNVDMHIAVALDALIRLIVERLSFELAQSFTYTGKINSYYL